MSEKKRWICLYVENEIGVLARISGLFSGKSYNLNSLTVGETEDTTVSRMTISFTSDDRTFEQVKKQLNRSVEVIKVVDYTDIPIHNKEILFIKVKECNTDDKDEVFRIANAFNFKITDYDRKNILVECLQTENQNNDALGTFVDSRVLETLNEDSANVAYELTFLAVGIVCAVYVLGVKKQKLIPRREAPKYTGAIFETAGQFAYIYALADTAHAALAAPMISAYCVASVVWSRIFLKEKLSLKHYASILLVVAGIVILGILDI